MAQTGVRDSHYESESTVPLIETSNANFIFVISSNIVIASSAFTDLATSIHEHWFCARCVNAVQPEGEGVIVMEIGAYLLVCMYVSHCSTFDLQNSKYQVSFNYLHYTNEFLPKIYFTGIAILMHRYDGSLGSASQAMVAVDQFAWHFNRRTH